MSSYSLPWFAIYLGKTLFETGHDGDGMLAISGSLLRIASKTTGVIELRLEEFSHLVVRFHSSATESPVTVILQFLDPSLSKAPHVLTLRHIPHRELAWVNRLGCDFGKSESPASVASLCSLMTAFLKAATLLVIVFPFDSTSAARHGIQIYIGQ